VKSGRVVGGQGLYVQTRVFEIGGGGSDKDKDSGSGKGPGKDSDKDGGSGKDSDKDGGGGGSSNQADFELGGTTEISVPGGAVRLEIDIQAPLWGEYDTIEIYRNPTTTITGSNGGVPVLFTANPTEVLVAPTDFTVSTVNVHPAVPGGQRLESLVQRDYVLTEDSWFAVVVRGTDGNSASMFPVMPASLSQGGVLAMGATNALYVDVDGGGFDPPGVSCTNCGP
jgi:hypothetical protein